MIDLVVCGPELVKGRHGGDEPAAGAQARAEDRHRRLRMLEMLEHVEGDDQAVARALRRIIHERARS